MVRKQCGLEWGGGKRDKKGEETGGDQTRCRVWLRGHKTRAGVNPNQKLRDGNHGGEGEEDKYRIWEHGFLWC